MLKRIHTDSENNRDDSGAWLSIGDLMSVILMVFILLLISTVVKIKELEEQTKGSRVVIIQALEAMMKKNGIGVEINPDTGDISIMDSILFDSGKYDLKDEGVKFLETFIPHYSDVIYSTPGAQEEIVRVIIEGHTSSLGTETGNMSLSLRRSNSVYEKIDALNFQHKLAFSKKLLVSGRGESDAFQSDDLGSDRKVMFRLQFRGIEKLQELFDLKDKV